MPISRSLVGACLASRYQLDEYIGADTAAELYRAHHAQLANLRFIVRVLRADLVADVTAQAAFVDTARQLNASRTTTRVALIDIAQLPDQRSMMVFELREADVSLAEFVAWYDGTLGATPAPEPQTEEAEPPNGPRTQRMLAVVETLAGQIILDEYQVDEHIASDAISEYYTAHNPRYERLRLVLRVERLELVHDLGIAEGFAACARARVRERNARIEMMNFCNLPDHRIVLVAGLCANDVTPAEIQEWFVRGGAPLVGQVLDSAYLVEEPLAWAHEADVYLARGTDRPEDRFALRVMNAALVGNTAAETAFRGAAHGLAKLPAGGRFSGREVFELPDGRLCNAIRVRATDLRGREIIDAARAHTPSAPVDERRTTDRRRQIRAIGPEEALVGRILNEKFQVLEHVGSDPLGDLYAVRNLHYPNTRCVVRVLRLDRVDDVAARKAFGDNATKLAGRHDHRIATASFIELADRRLVSELQLLTGDLTPDEVIDWYMDA